MVGEDDMWHGMREGGWCEAAREGDEDWMVKKFVGRDNKGARLLGTMFSFLLFDRKLIGRRKSGSGR